MVSIAPNAIDINDFHFREHLRLRVFENTTFPEHCNLVSVASRFGLIFIAGEKNEFYAVQVKDIESLSKEVTEFKQRVIPLESKPLHISVNCDSTKLAVVVMKENCPHVIFYDVLSFLKQSIQIVNHTRLSSNSGCKVLQIDWNPALQDVFTAVKNDGSLLVYEFKGAPIELPPAANASCFCWSPKGKQLAIGSRDGKITQYKIDLKAVKSIEAPPGFGSVTSLCWVSSFQFFGVFHSADQASLICVDAPKTGAVIYTTYDDVCYSNGSVRPEQFYLIHQLHWNVLFVASSNSMELAILGMDANGKWTQWNLNDSSRASLPLSAKHVDTLPIGCAFNIGTTKFKVGDDIKQGPALVVLSDHGMMCMFNAINSRPGAMDICSPLENVSDRSGEALFTLKQAAIQQGLKPAAALEVQPAEQTKPLVQVPAQQQIPSVQSQTISKPVATFGAATFSQSTNMQAPKPAISLVNTSTPAQIPGLFRSVSNAFASPQTTFAGFGQSALASSLGTATISTSPQSPVLATPEPVTLLTPLTVKPSNLEVDSKVSKRRKTNLNEKLPVTDETEKIIANLVREECVTLESELLELFKRSVTISSSKIGTDAEMMDMAKKEVDIEQFHSAIKDSTNTLDSEVYTLKQTMLQTWACYEEARTRLTSFKDPMTKVLLQSMPLNPASQHQMEEIERMMFYLSSQMEQANQSLDEQWDSFQDAMMKTDKMKLPTMESIYQSMVQHTKIVQKQKYILRHIAVRIKGKMKARDQTLMNLTTNRGKSLQGVPNIEEELSKLQIQQSIVPQTYNKLIMRQSKMNEAKVKILQELLVNREASKICVSKPQLDSSTAQLTTLLAAPLSPIGKTLGRIDNLVNSTPKAKTITELKMQKVPVQTYTPPPQAFGTGTESKSTIGIAPTVLFGKTTPSTTPAAPTLAPVATVNQSNVFKPPAPASITPSLSSTLFGKPTVLVPVPGPGNTCSVLSSSSSTNETKPAFSFNTFNSATPTGTAGGLFGSITPVSPALPPTSTMSTTFAFASSTSGFSFNTTPVATSAPSLEVKLAKPALLATPTTPPVSGGLLFGFSAGTLKTGSIFTPPTATTAAPMSAISSIIPANTGFTLTTISPSTTSLASNASATTLRASDSATTITSMFSSTSSSLPSAQVINAKPSIFGSTSNVFGKNTGSSTNLFGSTAVTTATGSIFGNSAVVTSAHSKPLFESVTANANSTPPVSKAAFTKPAVACPILFSAATTNVAAVSTATSDTSILGGSATVSTAPEKSLFGSSGTSSVVTSSRIRPLFGTTTGTSTINLASTVLTASTTSTEVKPLIGTSITTVATGSSFGQALATISTSSIGSTSSTLFGTTSSSSTVAPASTQSTTITPSSTAFGAVATSAPMPSVGSIAVTTASPTFGSIVTSAPPAFSAVTTLASASVFGTATTTPATSPVFGASTIPIFASAATTTATSSVFGSTTSAPAFGSGSVFGGAPAFGSASIFGGSVGTLLTTTAPSLFSAPVASAASPFGVSPFAATKTTSPFRGISSSSGFSSSGNLFAQPAKFASGRSIFGGGNTAAVATTAGTSAFGSGSSAFGSAPTAATPPFGSPSSFGTSSNSPFAATAATTQTQGGAFGSTATFGSSSVFGGTQASKSPFASPNPTASSNAFGGFGNLSVGGSSTFGSPSTGSPAANPFGAKTEQKSTFGSGNLFASPASTSTGNIFGSSSSTSTFGGSAGSGGFGSSTFGQPSTFGSSNFSATPTGAFSSGGNQSVQQSGFGNPASFQKPAFGSTPVFGSQPAFGGSPSFGAAPIFGGGATFGSPGKVFGGGSATPEANASPFGGVAAQSSTFGSIAQQNTVGFGNLAQQATTPTTNIFSGGSSFTNWRN